MSVEPVFLFSLPRSGSTLLQRVLVSHSRVASASEPWILLPLAAMSGERNVRVFADYSHRGAVEAIADLASCMPEGRRTYREILAEAVLAMYEAAGDGRARYFVDKTPRYFLIVDFILEMFPRSKAILLVRNPLDVLASVISTWGNDRLWLHNALLDLYEGPLRLHEAAVRHPDRLLRLRYEDLVSAPEQTCRNVCAHLDLPFEPAMLEATGGGALVGRMGDKSSNSARSGLVADSVDRWRQVLATPLRRWFGRRYLRRLGPEVLRTCGVEADELDGQLQQLPVRWNRTVSDAVALAASFAAAGLGLGAVRGLWKVRRGLPIPKLD